MLDQRPIPSASNGKVPTSLDDSLLTSQPQPLESVPVSPNPKVPAVWWRQFNQGWDNLSIRLKLTLLLVAAAAVPAVIVTEGIGRIAQNDLIDGLQAGLQRGMDTLDDGIRSAQEDSKVDANTIGHLVETAAIDLSNPKEVAANRSRLQYFIADANILEAGEQQSFIVLTDAQGRVVAQNNQILAGNFASYPALPKDGSVPAPTTFRPLAVPVGASLADLSIFKDALSNNKLLDGVELLKSDQLKRLGLAEQAAINVRSQDTKGLAEAKQPAPEGTYDIDQGKIGLVAMAVHPLSVKGRVVGSAIVGRVLNRDFGVVDRVKQSAGVATATLFAQDWRVSTNVPYSDKSTRAIGTRVSREVADQVLTQGKTFTGRANIVGDNYLTLYKPLYDHRQTLNPAQAKPIGIL